MYVVMTRGKKKGDYIQFRVRDDFKEDVRITAELRGLSVSGLIHSLLVRAVREEKEYSPRAYPQGERAVNVLKGDEPMATDVLDLNNDVQFSLMSLDRLEETDDRIMTVRNEGETTDDEVQIRTPDSRTQATGKTKRKATR